MAMYEQAFGFDEAPFDLQPDPDFCLLLPNHEKAYNQLDYSMRNCEGFSVLSGEIGCGKTTLLRRLMLNAGPDFTLGFISDTVRLEGEVLDRTLLAFGLEVVERGNWTENYRRFTDFVVAEYTAGRAAVLIIDEAQNLNSEALEEVRILSNINNGKHRLLHIVLAGQPELRQALSLPRHEQLMQRVSRVFHLLPLTHKESLKYIVHRLHTAGATKTVFSREACDLVYSVSQGVPRLINQLCDTSLVYAYGLKRTIVTRNIVDLVVRDRLEALSSSRSDRIGSLGSAPVPNGEAKLLVEKHAVNGVASANENRGPEFPSDKTYVQGMDLVSVDSGTANRFGYRDVEALSNRSWLDFVVAYDRDRVRKIFQYYQNLKEERFEFSATVQGKDSVEREARFSFFRQTADLAPYFRLKVQFYDDNLGL